MTERLSVGLVQANIGWDYGAREAEGEGAGKYASTYILPYSVGLLQAYAQRHAKRKERYEFKLPIYRRMRLESAVEQLRGADVVGFSCYVWNEQFSLELARRLKAVRPDTLIVFGGPQVPDDAEAFLRAHPEVDLACHGEGEAVFLEVLERTPSPDYSGIPGVSYLDGEGRYVDTPRSPRWRDLSALPSPFLDGIFEPVIQANPGTRWYLIWETNRGCPFSCTFCDWGSAVAAKVYTFDLERLYREIDWMAEHRIEYVYCADANFGILPRDLQIAEYAVESRRRHGYPASLNVQSTKNATERAWRIQKLLTGAMNTIGVTVSFQSLDPHTLKSVRRDNISSDTFRELQRRYASDGIPTYTDLILGLPGESYASFADGIDRLIREGQHDRVMFHNCSVLPNAEMAQPEYRARHGLQTVAQQILNSHALLDAADEVPERLEIVVGTASMPAADWVKAKAFSWMVDLLYFDRLFQIPAVALHLRYGLGYRDLVEAVAGADAAEFPVLASIQAGFLAKAREIQRGGPEYTPSSDWLGIWWPPDELALVQLGAEGRLADFYTEIERLLIGLLFERDVDFDLLLLHEMVELNRTLFKLPFQDKPLLLTLRHNLWDYYRGAVTGAPVALEARPSTLRVPRGAAWASWQEWAGHIGGMQYRKQGYLHAPTPIGPSSAPRPSAAAASAGLP